MTTFTALRAVRRASLTGASALVVGLAAPLAAQQQGGVVLPSEAFTPNVQPVLQVERAAGPILLDGVLDEPTWARAARATNFTEYNPREGRRPEVGTEALMTYDDTHLYVAFIAHDDPGSVRHSLRDRDNAYADDWVGLMLDTYGDAAWGYELFVNPRGVQMDLRMSSTSGEDSGFDLIWDAEARLTPSGWQVEMAIPFASLRFPAAEAQRWKVNFWRNRPRGFRQQISWARIDRNDPCFMCQWGAVEGIRGVKPGGKLEILPGVISGWSARRTDPGDPASPFGEGTLKAEASLGLRYSFAGGLTAEGTVNPDFSQVESDVPQVDVNTTFALFYPERRPFFQEGSELFSTFVDVVNTRQINNPITAGKLVGRMGRTAVAYLGAVDETTPILLPFEERSYVGVARRSVSNILRGRRTFGAQSYAGAILTDRRYEGGGGNTVGGVDGTVRFLGNYQLEFQLVGSATTEPDDPALTAGLEDVTFDGGRHTAAFDGEHLTGYAQYTSLERNARFWSFDFDYWASSPAFRADNGFEFSNAFRRLSMWQGLAFRPEGRVVQTIRPNLYTFGVWNWDDRRKQVRVAPSLELNLVGQTFVDLEVELGREHFRGVEFPDMRWADLYLETRLGEPLQVGLWMGHGDAVARNLAVPELGTATEVELSGTIRPAARVTLQPSVTWSRLEAQDDGEEFFSGYIGRLRVGVQFTREFFLRLITTYNDFSRRLDVEPLLTYRLNPFSLVYVGSSVRLADAPGAGGFAATDRQYFAKFQYLIRR